MKLSDDSKPCVVCKTPGERRPIEILPNGGILFMVQHDDGRICRWATYTSLEQMQKPERKHDPTNIVCPRCHKRGRVNWAYDDGVAADERAFRVKYIVVHEKKPGTWGKTKIKKRRRCQNFNQQERDEILKKVRRFIQSPPLPLVVTETRKS
jgi:hypothetical protein